MHVGKNYSFTEVLYWTRRDIYTLIILSVIPCSLYHFLGWKWLALPWLPIALLGTAVAFVIGFKNNASYDRLWEARKLWGGIVNSSRSWGIMVKDFITTKHAATEYTAEEISVIQRVLIDRHIAWMTALRYQLRESKSWEAIHQKHNAEYKNKWFSIEEHETQLMDALVPYLSPNELAKIATKTNKAAQIIGLQSTHLRELLDLGLIEDFRHIELESTLVELYNHQGGSERIKNFPYPRQYTTLNLWFIRLFVLLLPLGMLQEFEGLGANFIWLAIPFTVISGWVFTTMEKIGEASESPFEGSANDVPITAMAKGIEIDLLEMFDADVIPKPILAKNNILS